MREAAVIFFILVIVASALFAATANAVSNTGIRTPANTGFAGQGQFRQGMQAGIPAQGQAGGIVAPQTNFPAQAGIGQQRGAGIVAGDQPGTGPLNPAGTPGSSGTVGGGGPGTCYCIRAPCNCGGTSGGTGTITGAQLPTGGLQLPPGGGQLPTGGQISLNQPYQGQFTQPQTIPAGNAGGIQPRQF